MKKIYTILLFTIGVLFAGNLRAQDFENYNLYVQNPYLFNPAFSVDKPCIDAFLNARMRWVGFDGAPRRQTLGVRLPIGETMGAGIILASDKRGLNEQIQGRGSFGYKANFSDEHFLRLGLSLGFLQDRFATSDIIFSDLTDEVLASDALNGTSVFANAGLAYNFKQLEAQIFMPQLFERKNTNFYSVGVLSYNFLVGNSWGIKPSVLARGLGTTPGQVDLNLTAAWNEMLWAQVGYRSNTSMLAGVGVMYKQLGIAYIYEGGGGELSSVNTGTHEFQLSYCFGGEKVKKSNLTGKVTDKKTGLPTDAQVTIYETTDDGEKQVGQVNADATNGTYLYVAKQGRKYRMEVLKNEYYLETKSIEILDGEADKVLDFEVTPMKATVSITTQRNDNNQRVAVDVIITENGRTVATIVSSNTEDVTVDLKNDATYLFEVKDPRFVDNNQTLALVKGDIQKSVQLSLHPMIKINGTVTAKNTGDTKDAQITLTKGTTQVATVHTTAGKYEFTQPKGDVFNLEAKPDSATVYLGYNGSVDIKNITTDAVTQDIQLAAIPKGAFQLGVIKFKSGTAELTDESFPTLNALIKMMNETPSLKVEISGHTDNVGSAQINRDISQKRAQTCVDYIVANSTVAPSRMKAVGHGFDKPLVPNTTPENMATNRRVEFKVID